MSTERYSFSLTTFSPSGKLVQIEYALAAVSAGAPSVGIKCAKGVVIATEKNYKSILFKGLSVMKIKQITSHIGMIYSGIGPDYRVLVSKARKIAQDYQLVHGEPIPTTRLAEKVANVMQEYTQMGGVRPFGISLLIAGYDTLDKEPYLYQCDPSGNHFAWKAAVIGKNFSNGKSFLDRRYSDDLELEDAVHTAILTLKESFEGEMTGLNIEIGVCDEKGFKRLTPEEITDYLANVN